eukprot:CAMPEP_0182573020 /NCGR_PEP_ID=MMETSP1324-20130603/18026_1 /TAXON_ID=236786 /ORGANISM="Florenciella sp., Strain RCC1587" /LENGTH=95 /DNA_ID=CAMNT_0024788061 /DNA_START=146 /DNA_END=430 /DNA_ORIENTATION=+
MNGHDGTHTRAEPPSNVVAGKKKKKKKKGNATASPSPSVIAARTVHNITTAIRGGMAEEDAVGKIFLEPMKAYVNHNTVPKVRRGAAFGRRRRLP